MYPRAVPAFPQPDPASIGDADDWQLVSATILGDDVRLEYEPGER